MRPGLERQDWDTRWAVTDDHHGLMLAYCSPPRKDEGPSRAPGSPRGIGVRVGARARRTRGLSGLPGTAGRGHRRPQGKVRRAEPVAALYEARPGYPLGRVFHVGAFSQLEDQLCEMTIDFDPTAAGYSPDRADAINIAAESAAPRSSHLVCLIIAASSPGAEVHFVPERGAQIGGTLNESRTVWVEPAMGTGEFFTRSLASLPGQRAV